MSAEERPRILAMWPEGDPFRDFLVAAMETGCRPGEIMKVTAADVDLKEGVWRFPSKDYEKTGLLRVVYLTPTLLELTGRLMARHPVGPLFRNADGKPWRRRAIRNRFARKRARKKDRSPATLWRTPAATPTRPTLWPTASPSSRSRNSFQSRARQR
jgi:integrase/recombinase XerC